LNDAFRSGGNVEAYFDTRQIIEERPAASGRLDIEIAGWRDPIEGCDAYFCGLNCSVKIITLCNFFGHGLVLLLG
jgi:hypothetical protein